MMQNSLRKFLYRMEPATMKSVPGPPFIASWSKLPRDNILESESEKVKSISGDSSRNGAVVILFGWLGSVDKHMSKFAELYADEFGMASVRSSIGAREVFWDGRVEFERRADTICRWLLEHVDQSAADVVLELNVDTKSTEKFKKFYLHAFSNGGGFVVEAVLRRIYGDYNLGNGEFNKFAVLQRHLGGVIFDSCPIPLTLYTGWLACRSSIPGWTGLALASAWAGAQIVAYPWSGNNTQEYHAYYKTGLLSDERRIPQMYLIGGKDDFLRYSRSFLVDHLLKDKRRLHFLENAEHCMLLVQSRPEYVKLCRDFIRETLDVCPTTGKHDDNRAKL